MEYLIKPRTIDQKDDDLVAHIWSGRDTVCKLSSVGKFNLKFYKIVDSDMKRRICTHCLNETTITVKSKRNKKSIS